MGNIRSYRELRVYQSSMDATMRIFELTNTFPRKEYSLVDQILRSSRSVCANIAEAWRKRRYPAHFVSKLSDAETEADETRVWVEIARRCGYLTVEQEDELYAAYDIILGQLVLMISNSKDWTIR